MRRFDRTSIWVISVWMTVCVAGSATDQPKSKVVAPVQSQTGQPGDYVIGPEDVLAVNVWKEPEISRSVPVRPDGMISIPLIGELGASGRTPAQLRSDIRQKLSRYLSNPEVTVIVQEAKSQKFNIVGEIEHPGCYNLSKPMTVLDAIALAGGFRDFARTTKIYVLRVNTQGESTRLPFNYKKVIQGKNTAENVRLEARDTVVVP